MSAEQAPTDVRLAAHPKPPRNAKNKAEKDAVAPSDKGSMEKLLKNLPELGVIFDLKKKIGEGTFSSVYLGSLKCQSSWTDAEKKLFAIKHLVPTSHPSRIEQELWCLRHIGGKENVIGVEFCLRRLDTVVFVMPYIPHEKFSDYMLTLEAEETRLYITALLTALKRVHQFNVIHRDIKPGNFLYDRLSKRFLLVDFGLAQRIIQLEPPLELQDTAVNMAKRKRIEELETPASKKMAIADGSAPFKPLQRDHPKVSTQPVREQGYGAVGVRSGACECSGRPMVCNECLSRKGSTAPRAGTQGFRPPEVLLKYHRQTTAVDIWACGVILLSILSGRYPFFKAPDDSTALAELISLFGSERLRKIAALLGKHLLMSNNTLQPVDLPETCRRLRQSPLNSNTDTNKSERINASVVFPESAFDLLLRLLDPNPYSRITAELALQHPFITSL